MTEVDVIDVAGLRIGFRRAGQGPGLVLLHGAYIDSRLWQRQLDQLSDEFTVVAWDAPGCGRSSDAPPGFDEVGLAQCLAGFIDGMGLRRPHLLGLSWGAGFALERKGYPADRTGGTSRRPGPLILRISRRRSARWRRCRRDLRSRSVRIRA